MTRKLGVFGHDAQFLLAFEDPLAVGIPAVVELALVLVRPLLSEPDAAHGARRGEIEEERFVGRHLLRVANELYGLVDQIFGQVIALLRSLWRLNLVVVIDQVGIILVGVAAEEAIIALETAA